MGKHIDYIDHKVHKLTIVGDSGERVKGEKIWDAVCECGNRTTIRSSEIKAGRKKSCGCAVKGRVFSEEGKRALSRAKLGTTGSKSNAWKGGKNKCQDCGKELSNRYGKRCQQCNGQYVNTDERRLSISKALKGVKKSPEHIERAREGLKKAWTYEKRLSVSGENSHSWKGGYTKDKRKIDGYRVWRDMVFERDNYTCQKCLNRGGSLRAHHIEPWALNEDLRLDEDNGITLCDSCHREYHKKYGYKSCDINNLNKFLNKQKVA